jgi:hypothetical protein
MGWPATYCDVAPIAQPMGDAGRYNTRGRYPMARSFRNIRTETALMAHKTPR